MFVKSIFKHENYENRRVVELFRSFNLLREGIASPFNTKLGRIEMS